MLEREIDRKERVIESDYLDKGGTLYICYTITFYIIMHPALYTFPLPSVKFIRYYLSIVLLTHKCHTGAVHNVQWDQNYNVAYQRHQTALLNIPLMAHTCVH